LNSRVDDFDLNLEDFAQRVNTDLVGKVVNIASRTGNFVKKFGGRLGDDLDNPLLAREAQEAASRIAAFYEQREFSKAMREIMSLADHANGYIADKAPWSLA
ncbi:MAG TPA: methionine--tRNA ligase, partial [Alcanivorax sp.]|nr:methionine--tRNA ligase [Alcanivorax sp.]